MKMIIEIRSRDTNRVREYRNKAVEAIYTFPLAEKIENYNINDVRLDKIYYENGEVITIIHYHLFYKRVGWNFRRANHLANYVAYESPGQELWPYNDYYISVSKENEEL